MSIEKEKEEGIVTMDDIEYFIREGHKHAHKVSKLPPLEQRTDKYSRLMQHAKKMGEVFEKDL